MELVGGTGAILRAAASPGNKGAGVARVSVRAPQTKAVTAYRFLVQRCFLIFLIFIFTDVRVKQTQRQGIKFPNALFCRERK